MIFISDNDVRLTLLVYGGLYLAISGYGKMLLTMISIT